MTTAPEAGTRLENLTRGTWTIDPSHTEIGFVARHLMVTKVRGQFADFTGTVTVADDLAASEVEVVVQMTSIDTRSADRDAHLRSADFFDVENHPQMTFRSTAFDGETLTGDLTIKGVTKPVGFEVEFGGTATDPWGNTRAGFEASATVNRKDWGLEWNVALESGGVLVSDKVTLTIEVELLKQA
jgi:polyisoprenoid-binding protein YceI